MDNPLESMSTEELMVNAQELLDNPLFSGVLCILEDTAMSDWDNTAHDETQKRESLWARVRAIRDVRDGLQRFVDNAKTGDKPSVGVI